MPYAMLESTFKSILRSGLVNCCSNMLFLLSQLWKAQAKLRSGGLQCLKCSEDPNKVSGLAAVQKLHCRTAKHVRGSSRPMSRTPDTLLLHAQRNFSELLGTRSVARGGLRHVVTCLNAFISSLSRNCRWLRVREPALCPCFPEPPLAFRKQVQCIWDLIARSSH